MIGRKVTNLMLTIVSITYCMIGRKVNNLMLSIVSITY